MLAGGTGLLPSAAIGSLRRYKCGQMTFYRHRAGGDAGGESGAQGCERKLGGTASAAAPRRPLTRAHAGPDPFLCVQTPAEINEGETLVSEIISEIRHGSQSECEVQDSGGGGQPVREDRAASRLRQGLLPRGESTYSPSPRGPRTPLTLINLRFY